MDFLFRRFYSKFGIEIGSDYHQFLDKCFIISLLLTFITSFCSTGFFHFDEHWQILEFLGLKLGKTTAELLPWEYHYKMRSWAQPLLYFIISKVFFLKNPFLMAFVFRFFTGIIGWFASCLWCLCLPYFFDEKKTWREQKVDFLPFMKWPVLFTLFIWFGPFLRVRPSSEGLSATFLLLGLAVLIAQLYQQNDQSPHRSLFVSGFVMGLSFLFRFQLGVCIFPIWLWILFFTRFPVWPKILFALGVCLAVALEFPIDYWGHHELTLAPWNYLYQNLVLKKAEGFPDMTWWQFFLSIIQKGVPPIGPILAIATVAFWFYRPRSLLTWATLPLYFAHSVLPAKAVRFIFPLAVIIPFLIPWWHGQLAALSMRYQNWRKHFSFRWVRNLFLALNFILLIFCSFRSSRPAVDIYQHIYNHSEIQTIYSWGESPYTMVGLELMFYRPTNLKLQEIASEEELKGLLQQLTPGQKMWLSIKERNKLDLLLKNGCVVEQSTHPIWFLDLFEAKWTKNVRLWALLRCSKN